MQPFTILMSHHFFIHTGNRTEALFDGLATLIEHDRRPFARFAFLVQGRGMERWLQQRLSERFGVWMGGDFPFPQTFFDELAGKVDVRLSAEHLVRERVRWQIEALLRKPEFAEDPLLAPMLAGAGRDQRRFQLSEQLANLFDQYQIFRPDWLAAWSRGEQVVDDPHAAWQMRLWRALALKPHRGALWQALIDRLETESDIPGLPDQVFAFGISFMPPLMLAALQALSRHVPVHLFTLSPTECFWADLPGRRQQLNIMLSQAESGLTALEMDFHPLLTALGRQGAHFQHLMLEAEAQVHGHLTYFQPPESSTLLGRLQRDLLENRIEKPEDRAQHLADNILFHRCHTPQREVEVLRDRILALLDAQPDLSLNDVVVMAPDLTPYRPFIESLFANIPHTIADRSHEMEAPALKLLRDWLSLVQGRFDWDEVFGFLHQPEVQARLRLSDQQVEQLYEVLVEQGRVRWGLAGDPHRNHWQDGLHRVLLGALMHAPEAVWEAHAPVSALEGKGIQALTPILGLLDQMTHWRHLAQNEVCASEWAAHIQALADFFYGEASPDRLPLLEAASALEAEAAVLGGQPISLETLVSWVRSLGNERRSSAGFLSNGMTFCDLLPMRSIPVKVVFLLGMNDRSYPRPRPAPDFDLMRGQFRIGDRDLRAEDRYTFLELLLSVRDRLEILWQGLSADKNTPQPPAQVVMELMDTLQRHYDVDVKALTRDHKAFPFHSEYFRKDSPLQGRWPADFEVCQALREPSEQGMEPVWQQPLPWQEKTLSLEMLGQALADPVSWALAQADIRFNALSVPPEPREKLAVDGLDRWHLREAIKSDKPDERLSQVLPRWRAEGRWPVSAAWDTVAQDSADLVKRVWNMLQEPVHELGDALTPEALALQVEAWTLTQFFTQRHQLGQWAFHPHRLKGEQALRYWLSHLMLNALEGEQATWIGHLKNKKKGSYPVLWHLLPMASEAAYDQLTQWMTLFEQVLRMPPLWHADWMVSWLTDKPEQQQENWLKAATLACGLRAPKEKEPEPDGSWLLYVRHLDETALRQRLEHDYAALAPLLTFWHAHQEWIQ